MREVPEREPEAIVKVIARRKRLGICRPATDLRRKRLELRVGSVEHLGPPRRIFDRVDLCATLDEEESEELNHIVEGEFVHAEDGKGERWGVSRGARECLESMAFGG